MFACILLLLFAQPAPEAEAKYYVTYYSYQSNPLKIRYTHTFAHFVKITPTSSEERTISWMPASLRIAVLRRRPEAGVNLSLEETFQLARSIGAEVRSYGPLEITQDLYDRADAQVRLLESGQVAYKCNDRRFRGQASNCIHAVSDLGGFLDTGTQSGDAATASVVRHLDAFVLRQPAKTEPTGLMLASFVSNQATPDQPDSAPDSSSTATLRVTVPEGARVWIDDNETRQSGTERVFESPPVPADKEFFYVVTATWHDGAPKEVSQKQRVAVRANQTARVSFMPTLYASRTPE
jgi:uncharacterized protein (TIGR03000 family)